MCHTSIAHLPDAAAIASDVLGAITERSPGIYSPVNAQHEVLALNTIKAIHEAQLASMEQRRDSQDRSVPVGEVTQVLLDVREAELRFHEAQVAQIERRTTALTR